MTNIDFINAVEFHYDLPDERIAKFPLGKRDESKLLIYKDKKIEHYIFKEIVHHLDSDYTLFFNNTKVIPARLFFRKEEGGLIEVFLLHPIHPSVVNLAMMQSKSCSWRCMIGGLKKWKNDLILKRELDYNGQKVEISVSLEDRVEQIVKFEWLPEDISFAEIISLFGNTPLPPYLNRNVEDEDEKNYQTVYAKNEGAVAAPTAGLHFTPEVLTDLFAKGIKEDFVTLHVGGGTFQPIKTENALEHPMHSEQIIITKENVKNVRAAKKIGVVGTTSMRSLESLFWIALKVHEKDKVVEKSLIEKNFLLEKLTPYAYDFEKIPSKMEVLTSLLQFMDENNLEQISGETQIMIVPKYKFQCCDALITNFHQPSTTLMLLVAAFVGTDWRKVYQSALDNNFRFLSYGDSSLLFRNNE